MAQVLKPYTFSAGATIVAAEHNDNFDTIYNEFNGNIDNDNIKDSAAIALSKLATTGNLTSTQLTTAKVIATSNSLALLPTTDSVTAMQLQDKDGNNILNVDTTNDRVGIGNTSPAVALDVTGDTHVTGNIYTVVNTDYSATSTITGWSSFTTKSIYYSTIGKKMFVVFNIAGTSNATTVSFTLPYSASVNTRNGSALIQDNGTNSTTPGLVQMLSSSNTVTVYKDCSMSGTAFTNSGAKAVYGSFTVDIN